MPDQMLPARPRVGLVFGDVDSAGPLREAVAAQVEIVYAASAADFDVSQLVDSGASAALVNLDGSDGLDGLAGRLADAGIAVVFNDPEISGKLEGWRYARWLRHLVAKLSGSTDYDPPRPAHADTGGNDALAETPAAHAPVMAECPALAGEPGRASAELAAAQPTPTNGTVLASEDGGRPGTVPIAASDGRTEVGAPVAAGLDALDAAPVPADPPDPPDPPDPQPQDSMTLDLDTAALSAMIDARLAQPERQGSSESAEVWRVAGVDVPDAPQAGGTADVAAGTPLRAGAPVDEADVLKGLPSVDDWQLVDPEAPVVETTVAQQPDQPEPAAPNDFAGLELVPLEAVVAIELHTEPIERWMQLDKHGGARRDERDKPALAADEKPA